MSLNFPLVSGERGENVKNENLGPFPEINFFSSVKGFIAEAGKRETISLTSRTALKPEAASNRDIISPPSSDKIIEPASRRFFGRSSNIGIVPGPEKMWARSPALIPDRK